MSNRLENTLKGLILIGLALFLTNSIINRTLLFYINRRFAWLTWVATILLLLMASAYRRTQPAASPQKHSHDDESDHHHHSGDRTWIALVLVALPLALGILVPPEPLGAQAVGVREVNTDGLGLSDDERVLDRAAIERNILDWLRIFGAADDPAAFAGQEATVTGFVYRDETFAADEFMVSRFVIVCCVADATAVGLTVSWPSSPDLPDDTWVQVQGTFQTPDEGAMPILVAERVTPTAPPDQPYLYP